MIQNMWYGILDAREVKAGKPVGVTRLGEKLVLWRDDQGKVACIYDQCCHRGAAMSHGWVKHDHVVCPFHGFEFDTSGKVKLIPANGRSSKVLEQYHVQSFHVEERYGIIWIWYGEKRDAYPEIPFFKELREGFSYGQFSEVWPVHYTRAIENQLDVVHLPFVHTNSIGRGNRTLVHGPVVIWEDHLMTFFVKNEVDDGNTIPLKASEIPDYRDLFSLQFQMPNLWQNIISDDIRIVAVFAPIDDEHTQIYIRFYQRFMKVPILKELVNFTSRFTNRYILHQDRRVVITQIPKKSELRMGEHLIPGDAPIMEYRKRREQLKNGVNW